MEKIEDESGWIKDDNLKLLLGELNPEGYVRVTGPLKGSKKNLGENTVFKICKINSSKTTSSYMVIKIGTWETLDKEYSNYNKYIKAGYLDPEYTVQLHEPIRYNDKAILPIDFVNLENYRILASYYKESPDKVLNKLLDEVLKPWYQASQIEQRDVNKYFDSRLKHHKESLFQECEQLFPGFADHSSCTVIQVKKILINPIFLLKKGEFILKDKIDFWTVESIIHGDLNFNNIFVGGDFRLKLIDYEYTREDIVFDDLARLECEIKFTLLKHYDVKSFWQGLMEFEDYIVRKLIFEDSSLPDSVKESEDLKKAAKCILVIRKYVKDIIDRYSQVNYEAYWTELLVRTLKYVSYRSINTDSSLTDSQKKYALISALLISDNYFENSGSKNENYPLTIFPGPYVVNDTILNVRNCISELNKELEGYNSILSDKTFSNEVMKRSEKLGTGLRTIEALEVSSAKELFKRGANLYSKAKYKVAAETFDKVLDIEPKNYKALAYKGVAFAQLNELQEAIKMFDKVLEIKPDFNMAWVNKGHALIDIGEYDDALQALNKALEIEPRNCEALAYKGLALAQLNDLEEAIKVFDKVLEIEPDLYVVWVNKGQALIDIGGYDDALQALNKALEIEPHRFEAWAYKGLALAQLNKLQEAISACDKALEIKPDLYKAWNTKGHSLINIGKEEDALEALNKALEIEPHRFEAWAYKGLALLRLNKLQEAINACDKALDIEPNNYETLVNKGYALARLSKFQEALAAFNKALEIKPDDSNIFYEYASVYALMKDKERAIQNLKHSVELNSSFKERARNDADFNELWEDIDFKKITE